jgi:hypothetical protein
MKHRIHIALALGCGLSFAVGLHAQSSLPAQQQKPPASQPQQQPARKPSETNPFPEDTNDVPVVPTNGATNGERAAAPPAAPGGESAGTTSLLKDDTDPVRSPDDPPPDSSGADSGFSSSLSGANDVNIPDEVKPTKHKKNSEPTEVVHQETAKEDEDVASFELSRKNWKAALSRFESALVTDAENPEVYWGIAEAARELGDYSKAKENYQKVMEYDPDSKHAREAKKWLKEPELANAPAVSKNRPTAQTQPQ